jgi:hypothetical protein
LSASGEGGQKEKRGGERPTQTIRHRYHHLFSGAEYTAARQLLLFPAAPEIVGVLSLSAACPQACKREQTI